MQKRACFRVNGYFTIFFLYFICSVFFYKKMCIIVLVFNYIVIDQLRGRDKHGCKFRRPIINDS